LGENSTLTRKGEIMDLHQSNKEAFIKAFTRKRTFVKIDKESLAFKERQDQTDRLCKEAFIQQARGKKRKV